LRWFRDRTSPDALARDHGISRATAYRYLDEVIAVLAGQAPDLHQALERAKEEGLSHVILDGKIIPSDRCNEPALSVRGEVIDLWYSGKAHTHGGNIQAVLAPDGFPLWVSDAGPGSVHDLTAARAHALPALVPTPFRARLHQMNFSEITSLHGWRQGRSQVLRRHRTGTSTQRTTTTRSRVTCPLLRMDQKAGGLRSSAPPVRPALLIRFGLTFYGEINAPA
jgi:hypothetical protein